MLKDVLNAMSYKPLGDSVLIFFVVVFIGLVVHTLLRSKRDVQHAAHLPLEDEPRR